MSKAGGRKSDRPDSVGDFPEDLVRSWVTQYRNRMLRAAHGYEGRFDEDVVGLAGNRDEWSRRPSTGWCPASPSRGPDARIIACPERSDSSISSHGEYGRLECELLAGGAACNTSSDPEGGPDCKVDVTLAGRVSPDVDSEPWPEGVGGAAVPRRLTSAVHLVGFPVARHECSSAIIRRRCSSERIAELRSGLRRVTI